jgi:hypothetical protein
MLIGSRPRTSSSAGRGRNLAMISLPSYSPPGREKPARTRFWTSTSRTP